MAHHRIRIRVPSRSARAALAASAGALLLSACVFAERLTVLSDDTEVTEAVTAVEVPDARSGSVEVVPGTGPGVRIHRTVRYRGDAEPVPGRRLSQGRLVLTDGCSGTCSTDWRLEVPAGATVKLSGSSGRITVSGVAAADLTTSSGDVRAEGVTGPLRVRTASGSVTATGLTGASADAVASSGDVRLEFVKGPGSVSAETTSGDVTLRLPAAPYRVEASTGSGRRDVSVPSDPAASARLAARTSSGDLRISAA
ncbi:DUF4097 family beta strand repeat-containing protein [Streptomyces sp. NPDC007369]|uniref:DUF4097 family beta strand repeat-containing protein n=1 Tax=Streptomyces sp. NPDC007369 TaxID=3154589 RepID=UPI0033D56642